jgi:predicted dehydrogenase
VKEAVQQYGYESIEQLVRWRLFKATGGGLMAELGSHQMDACSIFLGHVHPLAVQGYGGKNFYGVQGIGTEDQQKDIRDIEDHVYVTYEFPGPHYQQDNNDIAIATYSSINTNKSEPYGETVYGSRGTLIVNREQEALLTKEEGRGSEGGGPDQRLWVVQGQGSSGPVLQAYETTSGSAQAASGTDWATGVSRGYTEEMEHFCYCLREGIVGREAESVLRCPGPVAMADAIMALTANRAMALKQRIEFKDTWFDVDSPETPEASHPLPDENADDFLA